MKIGEKISMPFLVEPGHFIIVSGTFIGYNAGFAQVKYKKADLPIRLHKALDEVVVDYDLG